MKLNALESEMLIDIYDARDTNGKNRPTNTELIAMVTDIS